MIRAIVLAASLVAIGAPSAAHAGDAKTGDVARADALFAKAKELLAGGHVAEACDAFAESERAAQGIGVALHLADCYERDGRLASASRTFARAEKLASERQDKRAPLAHGRRERLELTVNRLTIAPTPAATKRGLEARVDDAPFANDEWANGLPVDPGDHVVALRFAGRTPRVIHVSILAGTRVTTIHVDDDPAPTGTTVPASGSASATASASGTGTASATASADSMATRKYIGLGLLGVTAAGVAVGSAFLVAKNGSTGNDGHGAPLVDHGAEVASTTSFAVAGAALVGAIVLYLSDAPKSEGATARATPSLTPSLSPSGAFVHGVF